MSRLILCILALVSTDALSQQCAQQRYLEPISNDALITTDIPFATADPYGIIGSQELKLDFYEALGDTLAARPLILFSFGGAFLIGDKSQPFIPDFCEYYAMRGYAVAAINYRIGFNTLDQGSAERAAYRAVQDVRAALRFFAEFSQAFRIDTNNIFLAGTSAGCVATLHSVFMTEQDRPASTYGTLLEPQNLGCTNCSGNNLYGNNDVPVKGIINCWGAMLDTLYISNLAQDSVPVISFHGTNDLIVPYVYGNPFQLPIFPPMYGSFSIHQRLNSAGIFNVLKPLNGAGHEPELTNWTYADTIFAKSRDFLYEIIKPKSQIIIGEQRACSGTTQNYSVEQHAGSVYCWNVSGGNVLADFGNTIEVQWTDSGVQQIIVREMNYLEAVGDEILLTVEVTQTPVAGYFITQYEKSIACQNQSLHHTTQTWDFGDGTTSTDVNPLHFYTSPGTYQVKLIVSNSSCSDSGTVVITMEFCPVADFDFTVEQLTASFTDLSVYANSLLWDFGDGNTSNQNNPVHAFSEQGVYAVQLFTTNSIGCSDTISKSVNVVSTSTFNAANEIFVEIFPNPTDEFLFLNFLSTSNEKVMIELFSNTGECVFKCALENFIREKLNFSAFPSGLYHLRLRQDARYFNKRIVKL